MVITQALIAAGILSIIFTAAVLATVAYNPRLWIGDAPKAMQEAIEPLTRREKRDRMIFALPFFVLIFGIPLWSAWNVEAALGGISFGEAFLHLWIIFMVINLVDLIIIDCLIIVWWQPKWTLMPGAEHLMHLINYGYHFNAHLKGTVMMTVVSAVFALIVAL